MGLYRSYLITYFKTFVYEISFSPVEFYLPVNYNIGTLFKEVLIWDGEVTPENGSFRRLSN